MDFFVTYIAPLIIMFCFYKIGEHYGAKHPSE